MDASRISAVDFVGVPVTDLDRARRFYGEVLGGVCHQAILRDSEGNSIDLHHRYVD